MITRIGYSGMGMQCNYGNVEIDRYLMFYAQSIAKGHIRAKQNVYSYHKWKSWSTIQYTFHRGRLKKFNENEVEWAGKAENLEVEAL